MKEQHSNTALEKLEKDLICFFVKNKNQKQQYYLSN